MPSWHLRNENGYSALATVEEIGHSEGKCQPLAIGKSESTDCLLLNIAYFTLNTFG